MFSSTGDWGWLIPMWILGAPFIGGLVLLMASPKSRSNDRPMMASAVR